MFTIALVFLLSCVSPPAPTGPGAEPAGVKATFAAPSPRSVCTENETRTCACPTAAEVGVERCLADDSGWGDCTCERYGAEIFVSPVAASGGDGTEANPYQTLDEALAAVRRAVRLGLPARGLVVWLGAGTYPLDASFTIPRKASGSSTTRPVVWRARPGEVARITGAVTLDPTAFTTVRPRTPGYSQIPAGSRANVVAVDLDTLGLSDPGQLTRRGFCGTAGSPSELFVDGVPLHLARWPNVDEHTIVEVDPTAATLSIFGETVPDVSGSYSRVGTSDGVGVFAKDALVDGKQFYLYRYYWEYLGVWYRAWFLTESSAGYPGDGNPFFYSYTEDLVDLSGALGASGSPSFADPEAVNHGFATIYSAVDDLNFVYAGTRPSRWSTATEPWLHGFWMYSWADCHVPLGGIDTASSTLTLGDSAGYGIATEQPWYAYNLLEELDQEGEYFIDRNTNRLYLWPPSGFSTAEVALSVLDEPLVVLDGARNVILQDLTLEAGRGDLLSISDARNVKVEGLRLRNSGGRGAVVDGTRVELTRLLVYNTAADGVQLDGGDRTSLVSGELSVTQSAFHDFGRWEWTYRPAVFVHGVGQRVENNHMWSAPHTAIFFDGNQHTIANNEIHDVLKFSSDAGAIYSGRDWGYRGNVIRNNYIHDLATSFSGYGVHGIYLDDCVSGISVEGNLLYGITGYGIQLGGGRDDLLVGNVVAASGAGLAADARCATWGVIPDPTPGSSWNLLEKLEAVAYQAEPWASTWPECAAIPDDYAIVLDPAYTWLYPEGTTFTGNLGWNNSTWIAESDAATSWFADTSDNLDAPVSPFVDEAGGDFHLDPTGPMADIPGFADIPLDDIGITP